MNPNPCRFCHQPGVLISVFNGRVRYEGSKKQFKVICDTDECWVGPVCLSELDAVREWNQAMKEPADLNLCTPI